MGYKVLFFVDRMRIGGIQVLLRNLLENFDPNVIHCDFLVLDDGIEYEYEDKFREMGATVYKLKGVWLDSPEAYVKYCKSMDAFFKEHHDYKAVHMNASSKNFMLLYYAKKYGIRKRIVHSHNTGFQTKSTFKIVVGGIFKFPMKLWGTDFFACSGIAGEWLFGKKMVRANKVYMMPNAIDLKKFEYHEDINQRVRENLGISKDTIIIGHVGRFTEQKNHNFLLEIYKEILAINHNTILILAGVGELMDSCKEKAKNLGISEHVKFLGFRNDITELIQTMDVFLMPSFFEGFPVTGIEAQAAGCPCVFSDTITREAALLDQTMYLNLNEPTSKWAMETLNVARTGNRKSSRDILKNKGFDIEDTVRYLEKFYIS